MKKPKKVKKEIRTFSEEFKREKVKLIEEGSQSVLEVSKEYDVSRNGVYRWIHKYSLMYQKAERIVIEKESEENKRKALASRVAELERALGQKQMEIEYLQKALELGSHLTGVDIKKKLGL